MINSIVCSYDLPPDRIARHPAERRDESRLLVLDRATGAIYHRQFRDIGEFLRAGDLLVLNDSRVIPARLYAHRLPGGGKVEIFLVSPAIGGCGPSAANGSTDHSGHPAVHRWRALVHPGKKVHTGDRLVIAPGQFDAQVVGYAGKGERIIEFDTRGTDWQTLLEHYGHTPLPPYILKARKQAREAPEDTPDDRVRYQTVYAAQPGSVAAPTAGLHFTETLLRDLESRGIEFARVTLHVGPGTFQPLTEEHLATGRLHEEAYNIASEEAARIRRARSEGRRIIPVGTTSVRVLESACDADGLPAAGSGTTQLLIAPGYSFRLADALVTNFHLPRSSLLLLVCAFAGCKPVLRAYAEAIASGYRFYSYGDAMLIL